MTEQEWVEKERARFESEFPVPGGLKFWPDSRHYRGFRGGRHKLQDRYNERWFGWLAAKRDAVTVDREALEQRNREMLAMEKRSVDGVCNLLARDCPSDCLISLHIENGSAYVEVMRDCDGETAQVEPNDDPLFTQLHRALKDALAISKDPAARAALEKVNHTGEGQSIRIDPKEPYNAPTAWPPSETMRVDGKEPGGEDE